MNKENNISYYTYTLDITILNILSLILFIIISSLIFIIEYHDNYIITNSSSTIIILMLLWLVIHEILHGVGFAIFKSVTKKNITYGIALEKGILYCMCKQPISKKVIMTSLLFPFTIIGVFTLIIGIMINNYCLVLLSIINIVSSIGDLVMTFYFLKCPKNITYLDLDDCTSFTVLSSTNLENIKVLGIKLIKTGLYDSENLIAKDRRRLIISRKSYFILGIILILFIITII